MQQQPPPQQQKKDDEDDHDDNDATNNDIHPFQVTCSSRDVILYALSIGFGSQAEKRYESSDLKYVWEHHEAFTAVPTFFLSFPFWATTTRSSSNIPPPTTTCDIPPFPPPIMKLNGILPDRFLRKGVKSISYDSSSSSSSYPIIHISQSIQWHDHGVFDAWRHKNGAIETSKTFSLSRLEILSVAPKSVGTFITSQAKIYHQHTTKSLCCCCCTMQMTMLVLGIPEDHVIPFSTASPSSSSLHASKPESTKKHTQQQQHQQQQQQQQQCVYEEDVVVAMNQALLFRLASGDSNKIHVDPAASSLERNDDDDDDDDDDADDDDDNIVQKKKKGATTRGPTLLMHGLGTLGMTVRVILQYLSSSSSSASSSQSASAAPTLEYLHAEFAKPVFLNDKLTVRLYWAAQHENDNAEAASKSINSSTRALVYQVRNSQTKQLVLLGHVGVVGVLTTSSRL